MVPGRSSKKPKDVTVLVVDDEPLVRESIAFDFETQGFRVFMAENGNEAMNLLRSEKIDLILSDYQMSGGDGLTLLEDVGQLEKAPIFIFLTGRSEWDITIPYEKGAEAVFFKPFDRNALVSLVKSKTLLATESKRKRTERVRVAFEVELQTQEGSLRSKVLNISHQGMFVELMKAFPGVDSLAEFRINLNPVLPVEIGGTGVVRWVRTDSKEFPSGCGIQFSHLDPITQRIVIELVNSIKTQSNFYSP